jgi:CO dehydrogenase/acetyl-CoA synthase gamma subunit (corrinoid Fe-S protein)
VEEHEKSPLIKAATNEYTLFAYRVVTSGCAILMTWWVLDLKEMTRELRREFNASLVLNEARLGKLEGAVSVIDNAVRMQSRAIETNQTSLQQLWHRLYEINQLQRPK